MTCLAFVCIDTPHKGSSHGKVKRLLCENAPRRLRGFADSRCDASVARPAARNRPAPEERISTTNRHIDRVLSTVTSGRAAAATRLAASWQRSWQMHRIDPADHAAPERTDDADLRARREASGELLSVSAPRLDDLFRLIGHCGCGVILTDADGLILDARVHDGDAEAFRAWGLEPGTAWGEDVQGTNGIGTCLAERRAVTIHRDQHYLPRNIGMSCMDAPVFGADGQIVAALDVSSARADQTEGFNALISASVGQVARQIESDLFRAAFSKARIVLAGETDAQGAAALLAVDGDDLVIGATRTARRLLSLERDGKIRPRPVRDLIGTQEDDAGSGLERAERAALLRALNRAEGNVSKAAETLGIGRATLYRRMKRLGIADFRPGVSRN
ncbi:sigma-54-dependent Fis family transcriptional regulator [Arenibacterium halophilum]|uniref:Sigma-54-dependent Fis family transcriptional regulator n=2 Tax=Arenibacterium halophilum TaxID=2583821 RepID=A0ABY2XB12_9RHOB|nr:sigma-54-dependent Fis family transcriptional regulator [Arenibacterium halophilum]